MIDFTSYEEVKLGDVAEFGRAKKGHIYPAGSSYIQVSASRGHVGYLYKKGEIESKNVVIIPQACIDMFYFNIILKKNIDEFLHRYSSGINIQEKEIGKFPIQLHCYTAQKAIVRVVRELDNRDNEQERELELLKLTKKSFLQQLFPDSQQITPNLRFANYHDDWEQSKLNRLAKFSKGKGYTKGDLLEEGDPIILYGRLYTNYQTRIMDVDTYVNSQENSILSDGGEVIVPSSGETSEDIARASVVVNNGIILGGDLNIIKPSKIIEPSFLALTISNGESQKELMKKAQGNSVVHLYNSDLKKVKILYPNFEEQTKIGYLFKQLDKTIALHERELELLNLTKKGFLQQIFPGNKQKYPNIRFENFDEEWEQCELIELAEFNPKSKLPKEFEYVDLESVVGTSLIDHRTETINSAPSRAQRLAEFGDLFYQTVRPYQKNNYLYELPYNNYVFSTGYAQMRPKYNSYFLLTLVQEEKFVSRVLERSTGTSYPSINSNDLSKLKVRVPKKEEQTKIGNFFKQLDEIITLQERELELLKLTKKGFLQQLFQIF